MERNNRPSGQQRPKQQSNSNKSQESNQGQNPNQNRNRNRNRNQQNRRHGKPHRPESIIKKLEKNTHLSPETYALVKAFKDTTDKIVQFVDPCSETQLLWSVSPNKWNIKEIMGHLIQTTELYRSRLIHTLEKKPEPFHLFDPDVEIRNEEFSTQSCENLLRRFIRERRELESLCMGTLNDDWNLTAEHPMKGQVSFKDTVAFIAEHDTMHINQIFMNLQRHEPWLKEVPKEEVKDEATQPVADDTKAPNNDQTESSENA